MPNRRMFANAVIESDLFIDMPPSAQALYFHLGMDTDDDGFVVAPRRIQRATGATDDDMQVLASRGFIIIFESGVLAITHHRANNILRSDRCKPTSCTAERMQLELSETGVYSLIEDFVTPVQTPMLLSGMPSDNQVATIGCPNLTNLTNLTNEDTLSGTPDRSSLVHEVVECLNSKTGKHFRASSKATARRINARIAEGFGLDDFKSVIDAKAAQWLNDPKMSRYLRPETLFGTKFEGYLNEEGEADDRYSEYDC